MADSNITKRALASALKDLMIDLPFDKINVSDICELSDMNRKSFYYHFKDKYDLVNWIFDTEFIAVANRRDYQNQWQVLVDTAEYFYENHTFYRKALSVSGQNSFSDHLREIMHPLLRQRFSTMFPEGENWDFQVNTFSDIFICALQRWLLEKDPMTASEFLEQGKIGIQYFAARIAQLEQKNTEENEEGA